MVKLINSNIISVVMNPAVGHLLPFSFTRSCRLPTPVVPLCEGEFACGAADLVLVEAGHQLSAHFDVSATVASLLVVVGSRKNCDHL